MVDFTDLHAKKLMAVFVAGQKHKRPPRAKAKNKNTELKEQIALFKWIFAVPEIRDVAFHIMNGGAKDPIKGAIYRRAGVRAGVPDIFIPVPRGTFHGMFIELKADATKRATVEQVEMISRFGRNGYYALVCHGCMAAKEAIEGYLRLSC